jgi:hypothetical protein
MFNQLVKEGFLYDSGKKLYSENEVLKPVYSVQLMGAAALIFSDIEQNGYEIEYSVFKNLYEIKMDESTVAFIQCPDVIFKKYIKY